MAKKVLNIIAEISKSTNRRIEDMMTELRARGYVGMLSRGVPHHIQLTTLPMTDVDSAVARLNKVATEFAPFELSVDSVGIWNSELLYLVPSFSQELNDIHRALALDSEKLWVPRIPMLLDKAEEVHNAAPFLSSMLTEHLKFAETRTIELSIKAIAIYESSPAYLVDRATLIGHKRTEE